MADPGFVGEGSPEFWDRLAGSYGSADQGDAPGRIVDRLFASGLLDPSDCVLEVGSGPGTYSLELAPRVRVLVCMDSSEAMLGRLSGALSGVPHNKVELFHQDWNAYVPRKGYDFCLAALCPGSGSPESLERMEGASRRGCAVVTWDRRVGDDLSARVLRELGVVRDGPVRGSRDAERWISETGRDGFSETFDVDVLREAPVAEVVAEETAKVRAHGIEGDVGGIVEELLGASGGTVRIEGRNTLRLTCWHV